MPRPAYALIRQLLLVLVILTAVPGIASAAGVLVPVDGRAPVHLQSQTVDVTLDDGLARTTVRQTFVSRRRGSIEAIYLFPIPDGAALVDVAMEVGGQRLEGLLAERKTARRTYDRIVRRRDDPALVEQIGRDRFRLSVFPVVPGKPTVVELTWIEHVPLTRGAHRYVYPLATGVEDVQPRCDLALTMTVQTSAPLKDVTCSLTDAKVKRRNPHEVVVSFEQRRSRLDTDVTLTAMIDRHEPRLNVATFRAGAGDGYFAAVVTAPDAQDDAILPRDVTLVMDTSGSMKGKKIEQARNAALYLVDNLRPTDRVNVLAFHHEATSFASEPVPATPRNRERLRAFVASLEARGGTALGDALRQAAAAPSAPGRVGTLVLLTDGQPTVGTIVLPEQIIDVAQAAARSGLRMFTFGVGKDVNAGLLRGIALAGRGRAEVFRLAGEIETRLTAFLLRTSSPVLSELSFDAQGVTLGAVYPRPIPDLYAGEQVVLTGRYRGEGDASFSVDANVAGAPVHLEQELTLEPTPGGRRWVRDLGARQTLSHLEDALRIRSGLGDGAYFAALNEGAYGTSGEIVEEIIRVSLESGVQSLYTSFLVLLPEDRARLAATDRGDLDDALRRSREARRRAAGGDAPLADRSADTDIVAAFADAAQRSVLEQERQRSAAGRGKGGRPHTSRAGSGSGEGGGGEDGGGFGAGGDEGEGASAGSSGTGGGGSVSSTGAGRGGVHRSRKWMRIGDTRPEEAVNLARRWLVRAQGGDGSWLAAGPQVSKGHRIAATSTALLTLLAARHTPRYGAHRREVRDGVSFLQSAQRSDGAFVPDTTPEAVRVNAMAACALIEVHRLTRGDMYEGAARASVDWLLLHAPPRDAWERLSGGEAVDGIAAAWTTIAFETARRARIELPRDEVRGAAHLVDAALRDRDGDDPWLAVAVLERAYAGGSGGNPRAFRVAGWRLSVAAEKADRSDPSFDVDHWFVRVLALQHVGGEDWAGFAQVLDSRARKGQRISSDRDFLGSWDPRGVRAPGAGRPLCTALHALTLQVHTRDGHLIGGCR